MQFDRRRTSISQTFRTAGYSLDLPAYENNLLNALAKSGGLPGAEALDEILIERGAFRQPTGTSRKTEKTEQKIEEFEGRGRQTIRVPLRLRPGQTFNLKPSDLILESGDVVLVKARRGDYFYTGGLLPTRVFPLPADRDLDVLEALALVGGSMLNGTVNGSNLSGTTTTGGTGPSLREPGHDRPQDRPPAARSRFSSASTAPCAIPANASRSNPETSW